MYGDDNELSFLGLVNRIVLIKKNKDKIIKKWKLSFDAR